MWPHPTAVVSEVPSRRYSQRRLRCCDFVATAIRLCHNVGWNCREGIRWDQSVGPRVLQAEADVLDLCETACDVAADFLGLSDDQADIC